MAWVAEYQLVLFGLFALGMWPRPLFMHVRDPICSALTRTNYLQDVQGKTQPQIPYQPPCYPTRLKHREEFSKDGNIGLSPVSRMEKITGTRWMRSRHGHQNQENTPIAAKFEDCIQLWQQLCSAMEADSPTWDLAKEAEDTNWMTSHVFFSDLSGRFRGWGNETGASSRSLDHALRKASNLKQDVCGILDDLNVQLLEAIELVQHTAMVLSPPIQLSEGVEYFNIPRQGESVEQQPVAISRRSFLQIQEIGNNVKATVECLFDLVPILQDPPPQDTFHASAKLAEDEPDIELAKSMFPKAPRYLINRLGHANWKRRQYQQELKDKIGTDAPKEASIGTRTLKMSQVFQPNSPTSKQVTTSRHRVVFSRMSSENGILSNPDSVFSNSRNSYFEGHTVTSIAESDQPPKEPNQPARWTRNAVPKPPIPLDSGEAFLCPYCLHEIFIGDDIKSSDDWADHVFVDLEPYMCTWDNCVRADKTFGLREEWFRHELDTHRLRRIWFCQSCRVEFKAPTELEIHLRETHKSQLDATQLSMMVSLCERYSQEPLADQQCQLCKSSCSDAEKLKEHLAIHLEQLALTSIKSDDGTEDEPSSTSYGGISAELELKKELLAEFLTEVRSNVFANQEDEQKRNEGNVVTSTDSDPGFLGDSDDEAPKEPVKLPLQPLPKTTGSRPVMTRHGESYVSKVESFIEHLDTTEVPITVQIAEAKREVQRRRASVDGAAPPLTSTNIKTIRTLPPPRNDIFIGRANDLAKLYKELSVPGHTCILSGVGGMGKSATAIEYTYQFEQAYSYIFWIQAETPVGCADTYGLIATHLVLKDSEEANDSERLIMLGREFLEQNDKRWLIVFDNVDETVDLQPYLPRNLLDTQGSILITTRKMELSRLTVPSNYARIELGELSMDDSRRILLSSTKEVHEDIRHHPEYQLAGEVAKFAERLPLALSHIAGYIQESGCSLADFVELWRQRRRHAASQPTPKASLTETDKALETVWNIGLREVTIDARDLLNILAFLDSDTIQKDLLVGEHEESLLEILHSSEAFRYKRMTSELKRRRLIQVRSRDGEEVLSIHRSLQTKILRDLDKDPQNRDRVFNQAFLLVRKRFPLPSPIQVPEPEKWPACIKYLRHVLSLRKVFLGSDINIAPSVGLARLLSDGGIGLWERGMNREGRELLEAAENILNSMNCEEDMLKANIHVIISLLIQDLGIAFRRESKDRIWKALQIRKDYQARTPPEQYSKDNDILLHNAWSDYACVLLQYNDYRNAAPIFSHCLAKYREWAAVDEDIPYEHAKYNHHMAFCEMYHHKFEEAIKFGERGVYFVSLATGPHSSSTHKWKFDLACVILQSGDVDRALKLHQEILTERMAQHGRDSFLTLQSYHAVGTLFTYLGDLQTAETHLRKALPATSILRATHPEAAVARTEFQLAQILQQRSEHLDEAEALFKSARAVLERLLPIDPLPDVSEDHEIALFDHLQPVFDGRFAGRELLRYVSAS